MSSVPKLVKSKRPSRFEDVRLKYDRCKDVVKWDWTANEALDLSRLVGKIYSCGKELLQWHNAEVDSLALAMKAKEAELSSLFPINNASDMNDISKWKHELHELSMQDDTY